MILQYIALSWKHVPVFVIDVNERFRLPKLQNEVISEDHLPKKEIKQTTSKEVKTAIANLITGITKWFLLL
jgi:hypothetical protein